MSDEADKKAQVEENFRRYRQILALESDYWTQRTGEYDEDDLQDVRFETIYEYHWVDAEDCDVDQYWAHGWTNEGEEFLREDSMEFTRHVTHRVFPTRYRLKDFRLSKSLRRVFNRNRDLKTIVRPLRVTPAMSELYLKHEKRLHDSHWKNLEAKYPPYGDGITRLMQTAVFHQHKLVAFSIFQLADYSVMSDMACWEWETADYYDRSLGILTALLEMRYAAQKGCKYYYLAGYCKYNRIYQYKTRFPALEFYDWDNDCWIDAKTPEAEKLLDQKLNYHYAKMDSKTYFILFEAVSQCQKDIVGTAVTSFYEERKPQRAADYNLLILTPDVERYSSGGYPFWAKRFGSLKRQRFERHGALETIRATYKNGLKMKFHFAPPDWVETAPAREEMRRLVNGEMKILHDPQGILAKLQKAMLSKGKSALKT